ncbi:MAG: GbsR/MarR family transcriptional regulator [Leucobacter sp.]
MALSEDFAEDLGSALATFLLWPPMAGRVSAALMMSPEPLTLAELQTRLGVSGGSISEMTRMLLTTGVIRRIKTPGVRRAQFEWAPDAWVNCVKHTATQMAQLRDLAIGTGDQVDDSEALFRNRLQEMQHYYELMTKRLSELAAEYETAFNRAQEKV